MAQIGPSNYFSNIASDLATRGPSQEAIHSATANSGGHAVHKQSALGKKGAPQIHVAEGVDITLPAQDSFKSAAPQLTEEASLEFAHLTGQTDALTDDESEISERKEKNHDRNVGLEKELQPKHKVISHKGVEQELDDKERYRLTELDSDLHRALGLNRDLKPEQLQAAQRMLDVSPTKIKKNAELKHVPEADCAMKPELVPVPLLSDTMDICAPGRDKQPLLQIEPSEAEMGVAHRHAAEMLANGHVPEQMIAGQ